MSVILKPGRERALRQGHHWIFSGAIHSYPEAYREGELVSIADSRGERLGWGFFHPKLSLAGRVVSVGEKDPYQSLKESLYEAIQSRAHLEGTKECPTACRLVNGEGDRLPGLVIDRYGPYVVIQVGALGMEKLLPFFVETIRALLPMVEGILDKSGGGSAREEGLSPRVRVLWGEIPSSVEIIEGGSRYLVDMLQGQKTGFFLDQREMRQWASTLSSGKRVLNGFSYTGGFTVAALRGGAVRVDSVDFSPGAIEACRYHVELNGFPVEEHGFFAEDMFDFLSRCTQEYDLIILDPPAFAKKKAHLPLAIKAYKKLVEMAMQRLSPSGTLMVSSCSYYLTEEALERSVRESAHRLHKQIQLLGRHRLAEDHPINLFHPESSYLKSLVVRL